jgi:hypothetical protein
MVMLRIGVKRWIGIRTLWRRMRVIFLILFLGMTVSACALPQFNAEERLFLNLSLDYLDAFESLR